MSRLPRPLPRPGNKDRPVDSDKVAIERIQDALSSLPLVTNKEQVTSERTDRQAFFLGQGSYPLTRTTGAERTQVQGVDTDITTNITIMGPATFTGVRFLGTIFVNVDGVLMLNNCEITKELTVAPGGKVHVSAGLFSGTGRLSNAGLATNCSIHGSHRTSGLPHLNVVVTVETT